MPMPFDCRSLPRPPPHRLRMGPPRAAARDRLPARREPSSQGAARHKAAAAHERPAPSHRCQGQAARPPPPRATRDDRHTRHDHALAPAVDCCGVDVPAAGEESRGRDPRDQAPRPAHGDRERDLGLLAYPMRARGLGHRVGRSTFARILKAKGIQPAPERPTSWRTFPKSHWGQLAACDFLATEVWTARGFVSYYTLFVIDLKTRIVEIAASTPNPDEAWMAQVAAAHGSRGRPLARSPFPALRSRLDLMCPLARDGEAWGRAGRSDALSVLRTQSPMSSASSARSSTSACGG